MSYIFCWSKYFFKRICLLNLIIIIIIIIIIILTFNICQGKKIDTSYHSGNGFFEIDIDIGSSKVAGAIMGLVKGYTKSLVIDLAYLLESHTTDELPEHVLGSTRFHRVDMEILKSYPHKEDEV